MRPAPGSRVKLAASSAIVGFIAGAATMAILVVIGERRAAPASADLPNEAVDESDTGSRATPPQVSMEPTAKSGEPPPVLPPPAPNPDAAPSLHAEPTAELRQRRLELPVQGAT